MLKFDKDLDALSCPECGGAYLHQMGVSLPTFAATSKITIHFWCENCTGMNGIDPAEHALDIYQHKGNTYLEWRTNVKPLDTLT